MSQNQSTVFRLVNNVHFVALMFPSYFPSSQSVIQTDVCLWSNHVCFSKYRTNIEKYFFLVFPFWRLKVKTLFRVPNEMHECLEIERVLALWKGCGCPQFLHPFYFNFRIPFFSSPTLNLWIFISSKFSCFLHNENCAGFNYDLL